MTIHEEIEAELARAIAKFPDCERLPNGTDPLIYKAREVMARRNCEQAYRAGVVTHAHIFEEEAMEVLAEEDPGKLRVELIQCAAVILKWLKDLARKGVVAESAARPPSGAPMCKAWCGMNRSDPAAIPRIPLIGPITPPAGPNLALCSRACADARKPLNPPPSDGGGA